MMNLFSYIASPKTHAWLPRATRCIDCLFCNRQDAKACRSILIVEKISEITFLGFSYSLNVRHERQTQVGEPPVAVRSMEGLGDCACLGMTNAYVKDGWSEHECLSHSICSH